MQLINIKIKKKLHLKNKTIQNFTPKVIIKLNNNLINVNILNNFIIILNIISKNIRVDFFVEHFLKADYAR